MPKELENTENTDEVINYLKNQSEAEQMQAAISELLKRQQATDKNMSAIMEKLASLNSYPAPQQPQPQQAGFGQIKEFAEAMRALKSYDNEIIQGFKTQQQEAQLAAQEILKSLPSEYDEEAAPEDKLLNFLIANFDKIPKKQQTAQPLPVPNFDPIPKKEQEVKNMDIDYREAAAAVPTEIKKALWSGQLNREQALNMGRAEAKKRGVPATDAHLNALYEAIMSEKPAGKKKK